MLVHVVMQHASRHPSASSDLVLCFSPGTLQAGSQPKAPYFLLKMDAEVQEQSRVAAAQAQLVAAEAELLAAEAELRQVSDSAIDATHLACIAAHVCPWRALAPGHDSVW